MINRALTYLIVGIIYSFSMSKVEYDQMKLADTVKKNERQAQAVSNE